MTWANGFSGTVNIQVTANGCNGPSSQVIRTVTITPTVGTPTAITVSAGTEPTCQLTNGTTTTTYATTATNNTGFNWSLSNGLAGSIGATTGIMTWANGFSGTVNIQVTANGCNGPSPQVTRTVTVNPNNTITLTSAVGTNAQTKCINTAITNITYSTTSATGATVTGLPAGVTGSWAANVVTISGTPTTSGTFNYTVTLTGGCGTITATGTITVIALPVPTITGQTTMCVNSGYYNYTTEPGMNGYSWSVSPGGIINGGSGTNQLTVSWIAPGLQWVSITYTNPNGCTPVTPFVLYVTVNPLPNQAGTITGTANVCAGANDVPYYVAPIPNALNYIWTLPAGATIASGPNTNSITVNFAANASSGNITVYANNLCGNGASSPPFAVTVTLLPAAAGNITGPASVCQGAAGVVYTVPTITGASGYTWTVPADFIIVSGANTNSITVDFSPTAVSGTITVAGTNSCGNGVVSPVFNVTVNAIPTAPHITALGDTLHSDAPTGNQWYFNGTAIAGATGQTWVAQHSGWYWDVVTLNGCSSDTSNHIYILKVGIEEPPVATNVVLYPNPNEGVFTLMFTSTKQEKYDIRVFNNLGVQILEMKNLDVMGTTRQTIDLRPAPNGMYSVIITNDLGSLVRKIVINK
jgi:hypothetical protein